MPKSKEEIQDIKIARSMEDMIHSEGWKHYSTILEHHIKMKTNEALAPVNAFATEVDGIKQVLVGESAKGAILGLRLALSLPSGIVQQHLKALTAGDEL